MTQRAHNQFFSLTLLLLVALVAPGCKQTAVETDDPPADPAAADVSRPVSAAFREVAKNAGIEFTYRNGHEAQQESILESLGGGVGMIDYDADGLVDILFPGGGYFSGTETHGHPPGLFRNLGEWRFAEVTASSGLLGAAHQYSHGCTGGDFNKDGFIDVATTGYGAVHLWQNQGDGTFLEVHGSARLQDELWSSSAGWGDLNQDGNLDLYVTHYVDWSFQKHPYCQGPNPGEREICSPKVYDGLPDAVYYSAGDGTFRDATSEVGLRSDGKGLGVLLADVDVDGDLDIYVANDTTDNFLYLNSGSERFEEVGILAGVARDEFGVPNGSMGVDLCDYNNDELPDLWCANYERESFALYRNDGEAQFLHVSQAAAITALGGLFVGFGTAFFDFDRDGDEDVVVANGHVINFPSSAPIKQLPLLLENDAERFHRIRLGPDSYFEQPHVGRGLALADLDRDGDLDIAVSHTNEPVAVLANDTIPKGSWLRLRLIGRSSNRDAIGARAVLHASGGNQLRQIKGGGSYLSQSELSLDWGIPAGSQLHGVTIFWPSGQMQELKLDHGNQFMTVLEPG